MVDPVVAVAAVAAVAALALAALDDYTHWTVPALGPWAVAGGAIHVAGRAGVYDSVQAAASADLLPLIPAAFAAVTWILVGLIAAQRGIPYRERYLAAAGSGLALTLVAALVVGLGVPADRILWVLAVPLLSALLAIVGYLAVGFVLADLFIDLRAAGFVTVAAVVYEGVAAVVAERFLDASGEAVLVDAVRTGYAAAGVDAAWWSVLVGQLAVGLLVVLAAGRLARVRTAAGQAAVLVVAVVTLWAGTVALLAGAALG